MTTRVRGRFGIALLVVFLACSPGGPLLTSNPNSVEESAPRIHRGDTVTIGSMFACLDSPGSVTVTDISPVGGTGLAVTGWAVRPNPFWQPAPPGAAGPRGLMIGVERATLADLDLPTSGVVNARCGKNGEGVELAVEVEKTTDGEAGASGWVVSYTSEGIARTLSFPLAVRLCNEDKAWARRCQALEL